MDSLTADTIIEDILQQYPHTRTVFLRHRMACPGCSMAPFDTLRDATTEYHLSLEAFLDELHQEITTHEQEMVML